MKSTFEKELESYFDDDETPLEKPFAYHISIEEVLKAKSKTLQEAEKEIIKKGNKIADGFNLLDSGRRAAYIRGLLDANNINRRHFG